MAYDKQSYRLIEGYSSGCSPYNIYCSIYAIYVGLVGCHKYVMNEFIGWLKAICKLKKKELREKLVNFFLNLLDHPS